MSDVNINDVKQYLMQLQDSICDALTQEDGEKSFLEDSWERKGLKQLSDKWATGKQKRVF